MVMSCFLVRLEKDGKMQPKHMWGKTVRMEANPYSVLHSFTTHISIIKIV